MTSCRNRSTCMTKDGAPSLAKEAARTDARQSLIAFDDIELSDWLMECVEDGLDAFLCAVAEAALAANAEDYLAIRPALVALRRKRNVKDATKVR